MGECNSFGWPNDEPIQVKKQKKQDIIKKMKKGTEINLYNKHNANGTPVFDSLFAKGILVKRVKSKKITQKMIKQGFESWAIDIIWCRNGDKPYRQELWFVHPNDIIEG